jgi:hypothetical protein
MRARSWIFDWISGRRGIVSRLLVLSSSCIDTTKGQYLHSIKLQTAWNSICHKLLFKVQHRFLSNSTVTCQGHNQVLVSREVASLQLPQYLPSKVPATAQQPFYSQRCQSLTQIWLLIQRTIKSCQLWKVRHHTCFAVDGDFAFSHTAPSQQKTQIFKVLSVVRLLYPNDGFEVLPKRQHDWGTETASSR